MKFRDFLEEQKETHGVLAFGRMNPITSGHEKLVNRVKDIAKKVGGSHHIVLSHSQDTKKNPLSPQQKVQHAKRAFPGTNFTHSTKESPNFLTQAADLHKKGITHLHAVGGSDRVAEFKKTLNKYNGTHQGALFNFKKIIVHSAGERDPDAEGASGMSASKMRGHAQKGNFNLFKSGAPSTMSHSHVKQMYNDVRRGLKLQEDLDIEFDLLLNEGVHDKGIFKAVFLAGGPGSGKDYVLDNTLEGHGLTEINSDKALEFLMDKEGLDKTMPEDEKGIRDFVRSKAKNITDLRQRLALAGRNGLIINGTGDDYEKIVKIKEKLEKLGYESAMLMVNTENDISAQRNIERGQRGGRTVPENIRREKWEAVQNSRPELGKLFGDKYFEFDNSQDLREAPPEIVKQKKDELLGIFKTIQGFVNTTPANPRAHEWVATELEKKDTLPINPEGENERQPHPNSNAASQAKQLGLQYYGFGRYGKDGVVTHRSIHDNLIEVETIQKNMEKRQKEKEKAAKDINEQFEDFFSEDLRQWFDPNHPKGGWKRIDSKGNVAGDCAREPGEPKPKCMSNEKRSQLSKKERAAAVRVKRKHDPVADRKGKGGKPVNVSNFGKGKLSESYGLSDSSAINLLLLGTAIDEEDISIEEEKAVKLLRDKYGKVKTFMLRRAAAKEAHTNNGIVMPYKNGYVIKLNEENENDISTISERLVLEQEEERKTSARRSFEGWRGETRSLRASSETNSATCDPTSSQETTGKETTCQEETGSTERRKLTLAEIRNRQKEKINESIDRGIEPGLSMSASGENLSRGVLKTKLLKKPLEELTGDTTTASIGDKKEDELKKVGISLQSFKSKRPIG